jgi:hypothetical protein
MDDKTDGAGGPAAISRRDCLAVGGAALIAASQPALASAPRTGPAGHRRTAPAFRIVSLDK